MRRGYLYALAAGATFGLSVPLSKLLLERVDVVLLAGLLYWGAALALSLWRLVPRRQAEREEGEAPLRRSDWPWLGLAIGAGGVVAPLLLLWGLDRTDAGTASLLLTLEAAFTALLAVAFFAESVTHRAVLGLLAISGAAALLALREQAGWGVSIGALAVAGATLCWGLDNNATGKVSAKDPLAIVRLKGLVAGSVNVGIALATGSDWPSLGATTAALAVGGLTVGVSLLCFILALREIGAARTTALFGTAPFIGTGLAALLFADSRTWVLAPAALAAGLGIWLLLTERHAHVHTHAPLTHEHRHVHDKHHQHEHAGPMRAPHSHVHTHGALTHTHAHAEDLHHRH